MPDLTPQDRNANTASGALAGAAQTLAINTRIMDTVVFYAVSGGTLNGTIDIEATIDGTTFLAARGWFVDDLDFIGATQHVLSLADTDWDNQAIIVPCSAFDQVRLNVSAFTSGSTTFEARAYTGPMFQMVVGDVAEGRPDSLQKMVLRVGGRAQNTWPPDTVQNDDRTGFYVSERGIQGTLISSRGGGLATHDHDDAIMAASTDGVSMAGGQTVDMDDTAPPNAVSAEADAVMAAYDRDGVAFTRPHGARVWSTEDDFTTTQTDQTLKAAPGANLALAIRTIVINAGAAVLITFEEGTATFFGEHDADALGWGAIIKYDPPRILGANTLFSITTSTTGPVRIEVSGETIPA